MPTITVLRRDGCVGEQNSLCVPVAANSWSLWLSVHEMMCRDQHRFGVSKEDEIWALAEKVWEDLASHKIVHSFIKVSKKVIKSCGDNKFLGVGGSISGGVRQDWVKTKGGVCWK